MQQHHGISDFLPYHGHFGGLGEGFSGSSYDTGAYSNTPPPSPMSSYSAPSAPSSNYGAPSYASSYPTVSVGASASDQTDVSENGYLPPNRRMRGRAMESDSSSQMITDLLFRFLGVNTLECRKRFVCELEFRNPMVEHAMRYIGWAFKAFQLNFVPKCLSPF